MDLTIIDLETGEELEMPTEFDEFTEQASIDYMDLPDLVLTTAHFFLILWQDMGLPSTMLSGGIITIVKRDKYPIMDIPFEKLDRKE